MTSKLRHLDLCSGIGGFSLGLEATGGVKTVAFCEREAYPQAILKQHWPDVPCYKNVKELTYDQLQADGLIPIDLLTAGYPCQPFSVAGKQRGTDDPRHLWPDIFRLVRECRPAVVLFENVEGHIRLGLDEVWSDLEDEGYAVRTFNIPAAGVGAPHRRNRLWIVGFNLAFTDSERLRRSEQAHRQNLDRLAEDKFNDGDELRVETAGRGDLRSAAVAFTEIERLQGAEQGHQQNLNRMAKDKCNDRDELRGEADRCRDPRSTAVADADSHRQQSHAHEIYDATQRDIQSHPTGSSRGGVESERCVSPSPDETDGRCSLADIEAFWETDPSTLESGVGRMAHGIPKRVDRVKALGNAIVPQIAYLLGVALLNTLREIPK